MLFNWMVTGQVVPTNPAAAVRGPTHVVKTGKTPVLDGAEWRTLLDSIPAVTLRDLRDRALIATLTYSDPELAVLRGAVSERPLRITRPARFSHRIAITGRFEPPGYEVRGFEPPRYWGRAG
jgi:hypothetical protein